MKFRIKLRDNTVIYVNNICIFNAGVHCQELTTWQKDGDTARLDRTIPLKNVCTVQDEGMLIYC